MKNGRRKAWLLVFLAFIFVLLTQVVSADGEGIVYKDPVKDRDNYSTVVYNSTNGLDISEANDIAETRDGFIWIGNYAGLIRYDGNTFERMDSTTGIRTVECLHVDKKDRLWIGTNDDGLAVMERGQFRFWKAEDGLLSNKINDISESDDGLIYIGTTSGMSYIREDDEALEVTHVDDPKIANAYIERSTLGSDGLIYCNTTEDDIFTLRDGKLVDYVDHNASEFSGITCIFQDPDDPTKTYIGTESSDFYLGDPRLGPEAAELIDIKPLTNVLAIEKFGKYIWITGRNGIGVLGSRGFHYMRDLPLNNSVNCMMEDYEGNLWFTSSRQGVMKIVPNRFTDVFERYSLPKNVVNTTCVYDGKLFIGTELGINVIDSNGAMDTFPLDSVEISGAVDQTGADLINMLEGVRIRSIIRDSKGGLWISTWRSLGLLYYKDGKLKVITEADGLPSNHIRAVHETQDGRMLVVCTGGLGVIKDGKIIKTYGQAEGIDNQESLTVCEAPNGDILLGSNGSGIYVINKDGVRTIGTEDGLESGIIMRIKHDAKRHVFWIVTGNSIAYINEDYQVTPITKFPYPDYFDMFENSKGDMWIISSNGIYIISADDLIANEKVEPIHYGHENGIPYDATSNAYSELTPEGNLYISGNAGVTKVNIENPLEVISDLKQAVPYIDIDAQRIYPDENGNFRISADIHKLTIYGYVFNYSLTDPLVSYQLEGFDPKPITVRRSELGPITYTNLHGGSYTFNMELKDAMGRGSKMLSIAIVKEKALYEEIGFYLFIFLVLSIILGKLVQNYVHKKMTSLEEKHREQSRRERVNNELQMANRIQASTLPHDFPPFPERHEFDVFASMDPAREVGGDFYDFFMIDDDHLCLIIADVSDKGIPAALFMMNSKVILESFSALGRSPAQILTDTNKKICSNNTMEMFVTVWLGILEISTGKLTAANAGHEYPVIGHAGGNFELFKDKHGFVIGGMDDIVYKEYELQLQPGDKLFLYTDGVTEAMNAEDEMFGVDRMLDALNQDIEADPEQLLINVGKAVEEFVKNAEQFDDLTMLSIAYKGPEANND